MRRSPKTRDYRSEKQDAPTRKDRITPSDVWRTKQQSGPVKTWADMTAKERAGVLATIRPPGVRG